MKRNGARDVWGCVVAGHVSNVLAVACFCVGCGLLADVEDQLDLFGRDTVGVSTS